MFGSERFWRIGDGIGSDGMGNGKVYRRDRRDHPRQGNFARGIERSVALRVGCLPKGQ